MWIFKKVIFYMIYLKKIYSYININLNNIPEEQAWDIILNRISYIYIIFTGLVIIKAIINVIVYII